MKRYGSILDFTHQRNDDIMRAFRQQLFSARKIVMSEILWRVANSPASRFWVSEERAAVVISAMHAGRPLPRMYPAKLEMFQEIYRRFLIERERQPGKTIAELMSVIVHQPAPKFYLSPRTIGEYISRINNGWYNNQSERYCGDHKGK